MAIPYYHVHAFTSAVFGGNPAGVCIVPAFPDARLMQRIAVENRHPQTAFVAPRADGDFDLRWFTPTVEDDLCGHATLAAAFVLALRGHAVWPVRFHTRSGPLPVARAADGFTLDLPAWHPAPCEPPPGLLGALGVAAAEVMKTRDYLVVVDSADQVRRLAPDIAALAAIEMGQGGAAVTAPASGDGVDYVLRFFVPSVGIPEDSATGSIHCGLAPYWAARLGKTRLRARQLSARGGEFVCDVAGERVRIGGAARLYSQGTIEL